MLRLRRQRTRLVEDISCESKDEVRWAHLAKAVNDRGQVVCGLIGKTIILDAICEWYCLFQSSGIV